MVTRRQFLKAGAFTTAWLAIPKQFRAASPVSASMAPFIERRDFELLAIPGGSLDPSAIDKYVMPLVIPPAMPPRSRGAALTSYIIAAKQLKQQVLPTNLPKTTVFAYGSQGLANTFNSPAFTVEANVNERIRVTWVNQLMTAMRKYQPHILPVDPTLHWANPPGPVDTMPMFMETPGSYTGPVPIVTHVHGAHVRADFDGLPDQWFLPNALDIPAGYYRKGSYYSSLYPTAPGQAVYEYSNDQRPTAIWYHDHTLGMTRLNVYAGLAGFWLIRNALERSLNLPGPSPRVGDWAGKPYYEIPIAIQDRSFNADGSLFYPDSRLFFGDYDPVAGGGYKPSTPVPPIWNPEFFGNAMIVNGRTWPFLEVEKRLYRFRLLNGCNARTLVLKIVTDPLAVRPVAPELSFHQIGSDGGLLPDHPVEMSYLLMAPAERADVIVDFSDAPVGSEFYLINEGPDEPYQGVIGAGYSDETTTGQVMKFVVVAKTNRGNLGEIPTALPAIDRLTTDLPERSLTLNEAAFLPQDVPVAAFLGTAADGPLGWEAPVTENVAYNSTEIWRFANLTDDAHPMHLHLVEFQVVDRLPFDRFGYFDAQQLYLANPVGDPPDPINYVTGPALPPEPNEMGWKDTLICPPFMITRIAAKFNKKGRYVWHCHIVEHEDNEMMRPYMVV